MSGGPPAAGGVAGFSEFKFYGQLEPDSLFQRLKAQEQEREKPGEVCASCEARVSGIVQFI
jgi:hypothetical protein